MFPVLPFLVFSGRFLRWQGDVTTTPFGTSLDGFFLFTELSGQVVDRHKGYVDRLFLYRNLLYSTCESFEYPVSI